MNKDHIDDFMDLSEQIERDEGVIVPVGEMVAHYYKLAQNGNISVEPSENAYYNAYLKTMKKYLVDKDYLNNKK